MSNPVNLKIITEQSSNAQINENFRKIQAEISSFRENVEPRLQASEDYLDYFETYLGGGRPVSRQQAIEYTDEQIEAKEAEILNELESRIGDVNSNISDLLDRTSNIEGTVTDIVHDVDEIEGKLTTTINQMSNIDGVVSDHTLLLEAHAGLIEAKAEKSEVYTRSEMDEALGEKVDTTVYTEQIGTLTSSFEEIAGRVESTEAEIDDLTGEMTSVVNELAELSITSGEVSQKVSSIEGELSDVGNRLAMAEGSITTLAGEVALKASQTEVDTLEGRMSEAESSLRVLPGMIEAKVERDGVIGSINASPEELLIEFDRVRIEGMLEARHIRSLAGLNINNQFIVDSQGNVRFAGELLQEQFDQYGEYSTHINNAVITQTSYYPPSNTTNVATLRTSELSFIAYEDQDSNNQWGYTHGMSLHSQGISFGFGGQYLDDVAIFAYKDHYSDGNTVLSLGADTVDLIQYSPLWEGQLYPLRSQTLRPKKRLSNCATGWALLWRGYEIGSGWLNHSYQITFIHKGHLQSTAGGFKATLSRGQKIVHKYLYVYDNRIEGHDDNNEHDNHLLALWRVFEF